MESCKGKTILFSHTPNSSFVVDNKIGPTNSPSCGNHKNNASFENNQKVATNEPTKYVAPTPELLVNNKYSTDNMNLSNYSTVKEDEETGENKRSIISSDSTSLVANSSERNPVTIFKADYPFFETTL